MRLLMPSHLRRTRSPRERLLVVTEALTVGLPFCTFKALTGLTLWAAEGPVRVVGGGLLLLAALDLGFNLVNAVAVTGWARRVLAVCTLQALALRLRATARAAEVATALDLLLSFVLVAGMIGFGGLRGLPPDLLQHWNLAVMVNVLGAGALRFAQAVAPAGTGA